MKCLAVWVPQPYDKDELFAPANPRDFDDRAGVYRLLRAKLGGNGWKCHTQDVCRARGIIPEVVVFLDSPEETPDRLLGGLGWRSAKWLVIQENEMIIPRNWRRGLHDAYDKIFTWNEELVDNSRYFKFNNPNKFPGDLPPATAEKEKFCLVVAGNHKRRHPYELYSAREEVIRWFERNHPDEFDLYGRGWTEYVFSGPKLVRGLNRFKCIKRLFARPFPSYRGEIGPKTPVMAEYRFCICYENARDFTGYISEKIFDCFFAGCVPVYWGAPNVLDHIPGECFIDKRDFPTCERLYDHMRGMTDREYLGKLNAAREFLSGEKGRRFSNEHYVDTLISHLPS